MVSGFWTGIFNTESDVSLEIEAKNIPKRDIYHSFVVDGIALAEFILNLRNQSNNYDIMNGGNYDYYALEMVRFFKVLKSFNAQVAIVLPLSHLYGNINDYENEASNQVYKLALKNITKLQNEDSNTNSIKGFFPPFIFQVIAEVSNKLKVPLIYTKNDIKRYIAKFVSVGDADAAIIMDSEYLIFPDIVAIPIDSFYHTDQGALMCTYITRQNLCEHIGLNDPKKLVDLSIMMGNQFTNHIMNDRYNIYTLLHQPPDPTYPALLMDATVEIINDNKEFSLTTASPFSELYEGDPDFKSAVNKSYEYFDISTGIVSEGNSFVRNEAEHCRLPPWAPYVFDGNDLYLEPFYDDYSHEISPLKITVPFRKIFFAMLNRDSVIEHFLQWDGPSTRILPKDNQTQKLEEILALQDTDRYQLLYKIIHKNFPTAPDIMSDPISQLQEPVRTAAFTLRYLLSLCFTDNQTPYTKTPADKQDYITNFSIVGAPPLDAFEFRALAAMVIILCFVNMTIARIPQVKPSPRKSHVATLYQTTLQHIIWLQQFLGLRKSIVEPERLFNARIFACAYESYGIISSENFFKYFLDKSSLEVLEKTRVNPLLRVIMYAYPGDLFTTFINCPRCLPSSLFSTGQKKRVISLLTGEVEEVSEDEVQVKKPTNDKYLPPPPPAAPSKKKKEEKKEIDEDAEMAFLLEMAAKNEGGGPKIVQAQPKTKNKGPAKRRVEKTDLNALKKEFEQDRDGKLEAKRQKKQVFHFRGEE